MEIYWLGILNETVDDRLTFLRDTYPHVEHFENKKIFFECLENSLQKDKTETIVAVLSFRSTAAGLDICKSVRSLGDKKSLSIVLVVEKAEIAQREAFVISGANDILLEPFGNLELQSKLDGFKSSTEYRRSAQKELHQSESIAMNLMDINSDLGQIISFSRNAIKQKDYEGLAQAIFNAISTITPNIFIEMFGHLNTYSFSSYTIDDTSLRDIKRLKSGNRVVAQDSIIQINQTNLVMHFREIDTDDNIIQGRLSDNLSTLGEIANMFVGTLKNEEQVNHINQLRKTFLSIIGHELTSGIKTIQTFTGETLRLTTGSKIDENFLRSVETPYKKIKKISKTINMLAEISLLKHEDIHKQPKIYPSEILEGGIVKWKKVTTRKNIPIHINSEKSKKYKANKRQITNILTNLLERIVEKNSNTSVVINVHVVPTDTVDRIVFLLIYSGEEPSLLDKKILTEHNINRLSQDEKNKINLKVLYSRLLADYLGGDIEVEKQPDQRIEISLSLLDSPAPIESPSSVCEQDVELF